MCIDDSSLQDAFFEDHRQLTRGLNDLLEALKKSDIHSAIEMAKELDKQVGPHVEFDKDVLFPALEKAQGHNSVESLAREHHVSLEVLKRLLSRPPSQPLTPAEQKELIEQVQTALDHAITCGTLVSYLTTLSPHEQAEILDKLRAIHKRGRRWSEISDV